MMILSTKVALAAPKLYLDPTATSVKKDQEFTIAVKIDVESSQVIGSDIALNYAGDDQEVVGVDNANYFSEFTWANNTIGKLEIHAFTSSIYQTKTGSGTLATIKFKAKKDTGSGTLSFNCEETGNNTNIINNNGQNILTCSNLNQTSITYSGTNSSSSPTPSPTPSPNPGNSTPTCGSLTLDPTSTTGIPKLITLSCKGSDSDSNITAAEFTFGDGVEPVIISKNIGKDGTISTTHSYTKTGTMSVKCRMRDDWSLSSNICSKTLVIKPQSTSSPTIKPKASPSGKILSLVDESSKPTYTPYPTTTPSEELPDPPSNTLWWIIPIIIIGGAMLVYLIYWYSKLTPPPIKY